MYAVHVISCKTNIENNFALIIAVVSRSKLIMILNINAEYNCLLKLL